MIKIGLTGGMASGKSSVAKALREEGIPIFDADACAHELTEQGGAALPVIARELGQQLVVNGVMDRQAVAELVFHNAEAKKHLETILHSMIWEHAEAFFKKHAAAPAVVLDVPLLIETGWNKRVDEVWLVYIPVEEQIRRVMIRDGMTREHALARLATQMTTEEKKPYADVVIDNSGTLEQTLTRLAGEIKRIKG